MVSTKNDFSESQLETLANLGITADISGRLRIGRQMAKDMGLGGGRWLKKEEDASVRNSIDGYDALPEQMREQRDAYSPLDYFHLAAAAGQFGVQRPTDDYASVQQGLETRLEAASFRMTGNGRPPQKIRDLYWDYNVMQAEKGHAPVTPKQFTETLIDGVEAELAKLELTARDLVDSAKMDLKVSPRDALNNAVDASYMQAVVSAVRPQLRAAQEKYARRERELVPTST